MLYSIIYLLSSNSSILDMTKVLREECFVCVSLLVCLNRLQTEDSCVMCIQVYELLEQFFIEFLNPHRELI